ncbi:hypothetical protein C9374_007697 [Naegleria lovaniensis]|uniref:K Homology domain-containing protein n=1 Tax=Naegleria lovaniensis TaxID=51637 RepID=A0AA88GGM9_NAELO|nr:uncharacterized protein C9374_007697 [Naegleria lovaniensis]KAG2379059.1 hypothetical protein C9374_007697 [Naegleria lovaniensis]
MITNPTPESEQQRNVWASMDDAPEESTNNNNTEQQFQNAKTGKIKRKLYALKKTRNEPYDTSMADASSSTSAPSSNFEEEETLQVADSSNNQTEEKGSSSRKKKHQHHHKSTPAQKSNYVAVRIASNRFTALKTEWESIYTPIVEKLHLQVRVNTKQQKVEIRIPPKKETMSTTEEEDDTEENESLKNLTKARDFVQAFMLGFAVEDALALLRLDDIYIESFDVKDVKRSLQGDHLSRAIARIAGKGGAVKFTIENATKTRIVVADARIHVMGSFANIQLARSAIVDLILGSPPGVVYNRLRVVSQRLKEQF